MDLAPPFQIGHPKAFELAYRVAQLSPECMNKVFFTNSGSEAVETALKMAIAYHRVRGEGQRTRLIHDVFMNGPEHLIEFFHGYTYSGHPLACAAGLATVA